MELRQLLESTKVGRFALERARELEDAVITIKHILSLHIGYTWQARQFVDLNFTGKVDVLLENLHKQLSQSSSTAWRLETPLLAALEEANRISRPRSEEREEDDPADSEMEQDLLGSPLTPTRAPKRPADGNAALSHKRRRLGDKQQVSRPETPFDLMGSAAENTQSPGRDMGVGTDLGLGAGAMDLNSLEMTTSWAEAFPTDTTELRFPPSPMPGEAFCVDSADMGFPPTPVPGEALSLYSGANSPLMDSDALDEVLCLRW